MSAPNVLFLAIDSLRADAVFGDHIPTPNLDRYAASGAQFRQCVSTTTSTTPSFSSMLTGCYPPRHGVRGLQGYRLSTAVTTMAEAFGAAGYQTHAEVTGPLVPETGVLRGFENAVHRPGYKVKPFVWRDDVMERMSSYTEPWLMLLHTWEVHRPYRPAPDYVRRWDKGGYEAVVAMSDEWLAPVIEAAGENTIVVITGDHGEEYPDTRMGQKMHRAATKSRKKFRLDKWFPYLDKKFAGMALGHGFALWEHLVRVPLIINGPGVAPARVEDQVRHVDLFPTLLDLCGITIPGDIDGRSVKSLMSGGTLPEEPAYMEAVGVKLEGDRIAAIRTPDWKLMRYKSDRSKEVLFRLDGGLPPDEKHNVLTRHPEVAGKLGAFLDRVQAIEADPDSPLSESDEAVIEQHLRDLGYL
ncbi:MAG: sulfatase-like hydrolase/transferase [Actinobacteria bacterium]|nr:sulfatase-like hydrolase/transferase [Actinomycetota bacterium]